MKRPIDLDSASILRITAIIAARPGIRSDAIAAEAGYSLSHTKNALCVLSRDAVAKPVPDAKERGWYLAAIADPLLAEWDRTRRKRGKSARPAKKSNPPTKRDQICELAQQPEGVSMAQIMAALGIGTRPGGKHCLDLARQGRLFRADRPGCRLRWFDTADRANAWEALPKADVSEWAEPRRKAWAKVAKKAKPVKQPKPVIVKPAKPAPVTITVVKAPAVVDYSRAKVTVCPSQSYDARYQVAPGSRVIGGYASAGIGRYLEVMT